MNDKIKILVTGGTFDKEYNLVNGQLYFRKTHIPEMLERGRCNLDYEIQTLMMVDSLDMTEKDRELIKESCQSSACDRIIITHGTDTMVETAHVLAHSNIAGKVIVLTGALIPYAFGTSSDGFFNLGAALAFAQTKPSGVYIAMNGMCFNWSEVRKNKSNGVFEKNY